MSIKSGLFSAVVAVFLLAAAGSPPAADFARDAERSRYALQAFQGFFSWDIGGWPDPAQLGQVVQLLVFVLAIFVIGALAGRARPIAAFVGGWGAAYGAAAIAGAVGGAISAEDRVGSALSPAASGLDHAYAGAGQATSMMVVGWVFGLTVMLGSFGKNQPKRRPKVAAAPVEPPPVQVPGHQDPSRQDPGTPPPTGWTEPAPAPKPKVAPAEAGLDPTLTTDRPAEAPGKP